jgi:hypothetical protein
MHLCIQDNHNGQKQWCYGTIQVTRLGKPILVANGPSLAADGNTIMNLHRNPKKIVPSSFALSPSRTKISMGGR